MVKINTKTPVEEVSSDAVAVAAEHDFKNAVLLVSLVVNLFFFVAWVTLEAMSQASGQTIASFLQ